MTLYILGGRSALVFNQSVKGIRISDSAVGHQVHHHHKCGEGEANALLMTMSIDI